MSLIFSFLGKTFHFQPNCKILNFPLLWGEEEITNEGSQTNTDSTYLEKIGPKYALFIVLIKYTINKKIE